MADAPPRLIAGAMSGTSADGVDVAVVHVTGRGTDMNVRLLAHRHRPYDAALKKRIFAIRQGGAVALADLAAAARQVSLAYAEAVNAAVSSAGVAAADLSAVAAHGQTLYHAPPNTIQWIDPALLAAEVGCPVVSDFRRADCAAGGQGAPLVPFADYVLFRSDDRTRVLLNVGGIANITVLPASAGLDRVVAFDTGPGNCVSDWLCRSRGPFGLSWDVDGAGASRGRVVPQVRDRFLSHPYFAAAPPKSTDGPAMIAAFSEAMSGSTNYDLSDLLATAAYVTAATVASSIQSHALRESGTVELIASGGGVHNKAIMGWLRSLLGPRVTVRRTGDFGIPEEAKEAIAFALLAAATLDGLPSNIPSATGARRPVVLGSVTPRP